HHIKRVLAYSTMSQIGYMFLAVGIGAYAAGFFHLLSHAFFKALLFMAAGNIIHAMHDEQDMRKYGGLWNQMRPTSIAFLVGSLSLVGVFPFVGFFSKEQILGAAFSKPDDTVVHFLWFIGFVTALITGFYTGRMWWLSFWGKPSPQRPVEHPHEAPAVMFVPVAILAVLATVGGLLQTKALGFGTDEVSNFLTSAVGSERWEGGSAEIALTLLTMLLAAALFVWAMRVRPWTAYVPWAQRLLERKYYFDEIYDAVFVRPLDWVAGFLQRDVERPVIDAFLAFSFPPGYHGYQFTERVPWIPQLSIFYRLGVDGISLWLVVLNAFLTVIAILATPVSARTGGFVGLMLAMSAGLAGVFMATDLVLFYVFWEAMLIPAYFLLWLYGEGARPGWAALKFVLYTLAGSLLMLVGV